LHVVDGVALLDIRVKAEDHALPVMKEKRDFAYR